MNGRRWYPKNGVRRKGRNSKGYSVSVVRTERIRKGGVRRE